MTGGCDVPASCCRSRVRVRGRWGHEVFAAVLRRRHLQWHVATAAGRAPREERGVRHGLVVGLGVAAARAGVVGGLVSELIVPAKKKWLKGGTV